MAQAQVNGRRIDLVPLATLGILLVMLLWAYWNSLLTAARYWDNPKYSHGYMVPLFTLVLLWLRRDPAVRIERRVAYVGGGLLALAAGLLAAATYLDIPVPQTSLMELLGIQAGVVGALLVIQQPFPVAGGAVGSRGRHWVAVPGFGHAIAGDLFPQPDAGNVFVRAGNSGDLFAGRRLEVARLGRASRWRF